MQALVEAFGVFAVLKKEFEIEQFLLLGTNDGSLTERFLRSSARGSWPQCKISATSPATSVLIMFSLPDDQLKGQDQRA